MKLGQQLKSTDKGETKESVTMKRLVSLLVAKETSPTSKSVLFPLDDLKMVLTL